MINKQHRFIEKIINGFLKMGQSRPLFVYCRPFLITISIIKIEKAQMVCLGFEPMDAGW